MLGKAGVVVDVGSLNEEESRELLVAYFHLPIVDFGCWKMLQGVGLLQLEVFNAGCRKKKSWACQGLRGTIVGHQHQTVLVHE